ncbi:MAG: GTP pyrophosphokinase family protein [Ruminococcaceae bacterium]|nr:GTP pyrophosphokinase family protein [Oscillospiraceae bacterium]
MYENINDNFIKNSVSDIISKETLEEIKNRTKEYTALMSYYKCAMMEIETKFNVLKEQFSLEHDRNPICSVTSRLKSLISIKDKLDRRGHDFTVESIEQNINDVAGVRVICSFKQDVYNLAAALIKQDDVVLIEEKDYIKHPKENGYRSLHIIVEIPIFLSHEKRKMKVEIQLRTIAMDFWASLEHQLRYKKETVFTDEMTAELLECANISAMLDVKMDHLRHNVFSPFLSLPEDEDYTITEVDSQKEQNRNVE